MKWRNEYGDVGADIMFWMFWIGAILVLAMLALTFVAGGRIAAALAGIGA